MEFNNKLESPMVDGVLCNKLTSEGQHQGSNFDVVISSIRSWSASSLNAPTPVFWHHQDFRCLGRDPVMVCILFFNSITRHIGPSCCCYHVVVHSSKCRKSSGIVVCICENPRPENREHKNPRDLLDMYLDIFFLKDIFSHSSTNCSYMSNTT